MKLKLDLHIHSDLSQDGRMTVGEIVDAARSAGLDGAAVCDHDALSPESDELPEGFVYVRGEEFSTEYGHLLGLFLNTPVASRDFDGIVREIREQGGLAVLAHPFERCTDPERFDPIADKLDGVEVKNGRADRKNRRANEMAAEFAEKTGLPSFAGSDAHVAREVGNCFVTVDVDEPTAEAVKAALLRPGNGVTGRDGRQVDVARSQWTKLNKTGGGIGKRIKWLAFAVKCAAGDLFRK